MELELSDDGKPIESFDFGRPEVGSENLKILQLTNNSRLWPIINIRLSEIKDSDVKITYPEILNPSETKLITISWNPKFERRTPLDITNVLTGELLIG